MQAASLGGFALPRLLGPGTGTSVLRQEHGVEIPLAEWVRRAQAGDLQAFEQLFNQYHRGVYNLVYQMVRSEADAADLTQEVFVRVWKSLPRLQAPEAFPSWVYRIAANLGRNWIRDHSRVRVESLDQGMDEEGSLREVPSPDAGPAAAYQTRSLQETVRSAIRSLTPDHQAVVTLHHLEGVPVEEIARIMNCSVGTVKSRLSRARNVLRRRLDGVIEG